MRPGGKTVNNKKNRDAKGTTGGHFAKCAAKAKIDIKRMWIAGLFEKHTAVKLVRFYRGES